MEKRTFTLILLIGLFGTLFSQDPVPYNPDNTNLPFSTNSNNITVWDGEDYNPLFVTGVNLGVSVPSTFPGQLAATRGDYTRWIEKIRELGFNTIRLYTLHYPRFYQVLDSFNLANPQSPVFLIQGVWLEEEGFPGYERDIYFLTDTMDSQIEEVIDCMHGNRIIPPRFGKAFGDFNVDVSKWVMSYLIGRELMHYEVWTTDSAHLNVNSFTGNHFSIQDASGTEAWIAERLDNVVDYERNSYGTERPVCFSSWPTLDPIEHPTETWTDEDTAQVDLSKINIVDAPAGFYVSYHAYPYYPDFISEDPGYQMFSDYLGPNSYLGYIYDLKSHYQDIPLIVAEFGTPSSWGVAHFAQSGMNHGGLNEYQQGWNTIRMFQNIRDAGAGGGMPFAWIDEWFKRTWLTDPFDYLKRKDWHNVTAAEQNFGMIGFKKDIVDMQEWGDFTGPDSYINKIKVGHDYAYFYLDIEIDSIMMDLQEMWISFDTYDDSLGESILPNGDTVDNRAEFALKVTNYEADLYVTQAYDLFGIWFYSSEPEQLYHSIPTDGAPWNLVRWKTNRFDYQVDYIGRLNAHRIEIPEESNDAVIISDDLVRVRIPWSLLQFVDPSTMTVVDDYKEIPGWQNSVSDGIAVSVFYQGSEATPSTRYTWLTWDLATDYVEYEKASMGVVENELYQFNNQSICFPDYYYAQYPDILQINADNGLLANDFDMEGNLMMTQIVEFPLHGHLDLSFDGSFTFIPDQNYTGFDYFTYSVFDGYDVSDTVTVVLELKGLSGVNEATESLVELFPNPARNNVMLSYPDAGESRLVEIFDINGNLIKTFQLNDNRQNLNVSDLARGIYILTISDGEEKNSEKLVVL